MGILDEISHGAEAHTFKSTDALFLRWKQHRDTTRGIPPYRGWLG